MRLETLHWLYAEELYKNPPERDTRVHVGLPTYGSTPAVCMLAFGVFVGHGVSARLISHIGQVDGAYLDRARNDLIRQAIANDSTHVMFVDQDVVLPENSLKRLVSHKVPYVAGSYWGKDDFYTPVSFHLDPFRRIYELEDCPMVPTVAEPLLGLDCWCGKPDDHLHSIGGAGMGCTLLSIPMLKHIAEHFSENPCPCGSPNCTGEKWFSTIETGEDIHLAMRCRELGYDRLLDGFVQCGHTRTHMVTRQNYDWARQNAPRCKVCDRVAIWEVEDEETAEKATLCYEHR